MHLKIIKRYVNALYEASENAGCLREISEDAKSFSEVYDESKDLRLFFQSPVISREKKHKAVDGLFKEKSSTMFLSFLHLLIKQNRESIVKEILSNFIEYKDEKAGIIKAEIISAIDPDEDLKKKLNLAINSYTGMKCNTTFRKDSELIGGFTVRVKDIIIDASIKRQLELLERKLTKAAL